MATAGFRTRASDASRDVEPNHDGIGYHQGVALGDANQISMPISPHVMIGMGPTADAIELTDESAIRHSSYQMRDGSEKVRCP